jgi:hypothetical protein
MRRFALALVVGALVASFSAGGVLAAGHPSLGFYVDGERYRTFGTTTDFSGTGAPLSTYDRIYALGTGLINVAEAKPGDPDFNGGRWAVMPITWSAGVTPVQLTSAEAVYEYEALGYLSIGTTPVRLFFCPVIHVPGS